MIIHFDPNNREDCALIRQLFRQTVEAPPTPEAVSIYPDISGNAPVGGVYPRSACEKVSNDTVGPDLVPDKPKRGRPAKAPEVAVQVAEQVCPVVTSTPEAVPALFTIDEVRKQLIAYSAATDRDTAKALLKKHGHADTLTDTKPEFFGDVIQAIAIANAPKKS